MVDPVDSNRVVGSFNDGDLTGRGYLAFANPTGKYIFVSLRPPSGMETDGITYFVITGLILFMAWAGVPSAWPNLPRNIGSFSLPAVLGSLIGLGATGLYRAAFDAPIKSPGIHDIGAMLELPYGEAYLGAFLVKPLAWLAMVFLVLAMHRHLKNYRGAPMLGGGVIAAYPSRPTLALSLKRLTTINAGVGLILVADVALVIYLHSLSHLGVFLPSD